MVVDGTFDKRCLIAFTVTIVIEDSGDDAIIIGELCEVKVEVTVVVVTVDDAVDESISGGLFVAIFVDAESGCFTLNIDGADCKASLRTVSFSEGVVGRDLASAAWPQMGAGTEQRTRGTRGPVVKEIRRCLPPPVSPSRWTARGWGLRETIFVYMPAEHAVGERSWGPP
ncbi:hypothetical protein NDU88_004017 [Pleurodeles waltl]|uniref:Uncharacterized protein n=1 Tax=Pleurodeles waltl TaxID=8319 RepID=A0AAV7T6Y1_PLEWA|nr:hypothetical protein NDU88_004017 [Pleurodeles waltl]